MSYRNNLVQLTKWTDSMNMYISTMTHLAITQNLYSFNPFADSSKGNDLLPMGTEDYIHIQIQQRNGRKTLIQGLTDDYIK